MKLINKDFVTAQQRARDFGFSNYGYPNNKKPPEIKNKSVFVEAVIIAEKKKKWIN